MVTLTVPFQSTLPRRERRSQNELISMRMEFQSTLPRRERRGKSGGNPRHRLHFNPRSREGSDGGPAPVLARGLTFQSTLPRRERHPYSADRFPSNQDFNPRSREGSDCVARTEHRAAAISIHAPAKGATGGPWPQAAFKTFQSTLPRRERRSSSMLFVPCVSFQSTLPRRERPAYP